MMKKKINNIRKCLFSNQKLNKSELIRLVIINNKAIIDVDYSIKSRGYYIVNNHEWIKQNLNSNKLNRRLKINNGDEIYNELIKI